MARRTVEMTLERIEKVDPVYDTVPGKLVVRSSAWRPGQDWRAHHKTFRGLSDTQTKHGRKLWSIG